MKLIILFTFPHTFWYDLCVSSGWWKVVRNTYKFGVHICIRTTKYESPETWQCGKESGVCGCGSLRKFGAAVTKKGCCAIHSAEMCKHRCVVSLCDQQRMRRRVYVTISENGQSFSTQNFFKYLLIGFYRVVCLYMEHDISCPRCAKAMLVCKEKEKKHQKWNKMKWHWIFVDSKNMGISGISTWTRRFFLFGQFLLTLFILYRWLLVGWLFFFLFHSGDKSIRAVFEVESNNLNCNEWTFFPWDGMIEEWSVLLCDFFVLNQTLIRQKQIKREAQTNHKKNCQLL